MNFSLTNVCLAAYLRANQNAMEGLERFLGQKALHTLYHSASINSQRMRLDGTPCVNASRLLRTSQCNIDN